MVEIQALTSFNPCFNGIATVTMQGLRTQGLEYMGFNPCFNGIATVTMQGLRTQGLEYMGFNPCFNGIATVTAKEKGICPYDNCFNPCFNGIATVTIWAYYKLVIEKGVSILVLMELPL